jgi:hypothetical protein
MAGQEVGSEARARHVATHDNKYGRNSYSKYHRVRLCSIGFVSFGNRSDYL